MAEPPEDSFATIEAVIRKVGGLAAATTLDGMMRDAYWKQKNLPAAVALGRAAAQHALAVAIHIEANQPDLAAQLRKRACGTCYNLASFTWSGWGEAEITITASDEKIGLDAARANLRLTAELKHGDLQFCRAHWIVGAHELAAGDFAAAIQSFKKSEEHARAANLRGEELLNVAFARLAEVLPQRDGVKSDPQFAAAVHRLAGVKDGDFFAGQVRKAMEVFSAKFAKS